VNLKRTTVLQRSSAAQDAEALGCEVGEPLAIFELEAPIAAGIGALFAAELFVSRRAAILLTDR